MSQTVFKPTDAQSLKLKTLSACQTCIHDAVVRRLEEVWASGLHTTRGDIRSVVHICFQDEAEDPRVRSEYERWLGYVPEELNAEIGTIGLAAGPYISTDGDIQEFKVNDPTRLEDFDKVVIQPSEGAVLVRFDMDMGDAVYGSDMRTLLWSGREETKTLANCFSAAWDALMACLIVGVEVSAVDKDGIAAAALGAECEDGHIVEEAKIVRLYGVNNVGAYDVSLSNGIYDGVLELDQVLGVRMDVEIVLEGGDHHLLGAEKVVQIGMTGAVGLGEAGVLDSCVMIPSIRRFDEVPILYGFVYVRPKTVVNIFWDEDAIPKNQGTLVKETDRLLEYWGSVAGFSKGMLQAMFFGKSDVFSALEGLLRVMHGQITTHKMILLQSSRFKSFINQHSKYAYNKSDINKMRARYNKVQHRGGNWDPAVDGPALDHARDGLARLVGISSREVALMATDGPGAIMPPTYHDPNHGHMQFRSKQGIPNCLGLLFFLYSGRILPWTEKKMDTKLVHKWVKDHLRDPTDGQQSEQVVSWQLYVWKERGRQWLNDCALKHALAQYGIGQDNWAMWMQFSNEAMGKPSTHPVFSVLLEDLPVTFPYFVKQVRTTRVASIRTLIAKLDTEGVKERTGKKTWNARFWSQEEIYTIAVTLFLNAERPRDPLRKNAYRKMGNLQEIAVLLPHRTPDELNSCLSRKSVHIGRAYRDFARLVQSSGLAVLEPYMTGDSDAAIHTFVDQGLTELAEEYADGTMVDDGVSTDLDSDDGWLLGHDDD